VGRLCLKKLSHQLTKLIGLRMERFFIHIHVLFQLRIGDSAKKDYVLISD